MVMVWKPDHYPVALGGVWYGTVCVMSAGYIRRQTGATASLSHGGTGSEAIGMTWITIRTSNLNVKLKREAAREHRWTKRSCIALIYDVCCTY